MIETMWSTPPPMLMGWVTQLGFFVCMIFLSISLASGLYYAAELAEENTVMARKVLKYWIVAVCVVHVLLWLVDGMPFWQCFWGLAANAAYSTLLHEYPFVKFFAPPAIASILLFCIDTCQWYLYFIDDGTPGYSVSMIIGFFGTMVWPVPFGFFVTLSLSDQGLPGLGTINNRGDQSIQKKRRGILGILDFFFKRGTPTSELKGY
eukprot:TRINITY_DN17119_c0_g1_i1.p1 TRINITY_DN17119_c0_g1~~TRINITY_DN17119_c0_g1_i1.p1  ORF type:complete len:216 (+),score=58.35 TRINITY_DN17119_c0_g1_i1:33-650(+)